MRRSSLKSTVPAMAALFLLAAVSSAALSTGAAKPIDPCSLLTQAEIQQALGKPVQPGKLTTNPNPAVGSSCVYVVDGYGSFNISLKPLSPFETAARMKAEFARMKMNPVDLPGLGDASFFTSPGYGMIQLHSIKDSHYILFTMLVPGATEAAQKTAAEKLMRTLLTRLK